MVPPWYAINIVHRTERGATDVCPVVKSSGDESLRKNLSESRCYGSHLHPWGTPGGSKIKAALRPCWSLIDGIGMSLNISCALGTARADRVARAYIGPDAPIDTGWGISLTWPFGAGVRYLDIRNHSREGSGERRVLLGIDA